MFKLRIECDLGFEFWVDIPEYEETYRVSTYGNIKNKENGRILKQQKDKKWGYYSVKLNGRRFKSHRVVANTFIRKQILKYNQVNHLDENPSNNRVENLEWCDIRYNNNYGTRNKRISEALKKKVLQIDTNGQIVKEWNSCIDIERTLNYPIGTICHRCNGSRKNYKGYVWKYKDAAL